MDERTERFDTGGRVTGWVGLAACAGLLGVWLARLGDPLPVPVLTGSLFFAALFWTAVVRPAVLVEGEQLVLRNMVATVRIPLAGVEDHALRQVLAVRAGERTYVGSGVGRSLKGTALGGRKETTAAVRGGGTTRVVNAADFVESRIADLTADARDRAGVARYSDEQVALGRTTTRSPAWLPVVLLGVTLVAFVVSLVL